MQRYFSWQLSELLCRCLENLFLSHHRLCERRTKQFKRSSGVCVTVSACSFARVCESKEFQSGSQYSNECITQWAAFVKRYVEPNHFKITGPTIILFKYCNQASKLTTWLHTQQSRHYAKQLQPWNEPKKEGVLHGMAV